MKIGCLSPVFNEEKLISGCVQSVKQFVRRHVILSANRSLYGDQRANDKTNEIAEDSGAIVITGDWCEEHVQRNRGVEMLQDMDWIICTDADMWPTKAFMENLLGYLGSTRADGVVCPQNAYWFDTNHILVNDTFCPVIAMRPWRRFWHIGNIDTNCQTFPDKIDHLNWCYPKDILKKVSTYSHSPEFPNHEDWFAKHFQTWKEGQPAIMPDGKIFQVERHELPEELKAYL